MKVVISAVLSILFSLHTISAFADQSIPAVASGHASSSSEKRVGKASFKLGRAIRSTVVT